MQLQQIKKRPRDPFPSPQAHLKKTKESLKGATREGTFWLRGRKRDRVASGEGPRSLRPEAEENTALSVSTLMIRRSHIHVSIHPGGPSPLSF